MVSFAISGMCFSCACVVAPSTLNPPAGGWAGIPYGQKVLIVIATIAAMVTITGTIINAVNEYHKW